MEKHYHDLDGEAVLFVVGMRFVVSRISYIESRERKEFDLREEVEKSALVVHHFVKRFTSCMRL